MLTPRSYLSYSSMTLFEKSPEGWADYYLYDQKQRITRNMKLGSDMATGLETGEASGDPLLDLMIARLPKFELMDKPLFAYLKDGKDEIRLLAKPDTAKPDYTAFKEYKTSTRKWTQKMVDESGQISYYATVIWLLTKKIPQDIELVCVETAYDEEGKVYCTGNVWPPIKTKRSMADIIKTTARIRRNWAEIKSFCEKELL